MTTASLRTFVWTANCSLTDELQSDSCTAFWWPDCFSARLTRAPPGSRSITPWSRPLAANRTRKKKKISFSNEHFSDKCEDCTPGPLRGTEPSCPSHPHLHLPPHPPTVCGVIQNNHLICPYPPNSHRPSLPGGVDQMDAVSSADR